MTTGGRRGFGLLGRSAVVALAVVVDLVIWDGDRGLRGGGMLPLALVPVVVLLVHATLLVRWDRPRSVFALQWALALVSSLAVPDFQPFAGLLVALHAVASRLPPRESALWLTSLLVPFGAQSSSTAAVAGGPAYRSFVLLLLLWSLVSLAVWGAGRLSWAAAQRAWRLQELQAAEAAEAIRSERLRLARELHDIVSSAVTAMLLQAAGARALARPEDARVRGALALIEASGVQAMSELHRLLGLLHAVDPDAAGTSTGPGPATADIGALVELARAAGRDVELLEEGVPGVLDPSVATAAYRVVQEGLTNSAKHSGSAARVVVCLRWSTDRLEVSVTDRPQGRALPAGQVAALSSGRGLAGLRERVTLVGGTLDSGPDGEGFRLVTRLPRAVVTVAPPNAAALGVRP